MRTAIYRFFIVPAILILMWNIFFTASQIVYADDENGRGDGERQITYCHVPPGNQNNPQTLTTSYQAYLNGHSNHNLDYLGECRKPDIVLRKTAGDPIETANGYSIKYTMSVGNNGTGTGTYNLNDSIEVPDGVSVTVDFISFVDDDGVSPPDVEPDFNGDDNTRIITGETILPGGIDTFMYTFTFDFDDTVTPDRRYCNGEIGEANTVKVVNKLRYNRRGNPQEVCTDLRIPEPKTRTIRIKADKVECNVEQALPNWGKGAANITATTASDYVANSNGRCELVDWNFQWSYDGSNPGDTFYGEAGNPWNTFSGTVSVEVPENNTVWMREVLQEDYIPFTYASDNTNESDESAEFYCHNDVLNYDNYDFININEEDDVYYCVGFNTLGTRHLKISEPTCEDGKRYAKYVPNEGSGGLDTVDDILWVGDYIAPINQWFEIPNDADSTSREEGAVILFDGSRVIIDLITAQENNDRQDFAGHLEFFGVELDGGITEGRPGFPFYKLENGGFHTDSVSPDGNQSVVFDFAVTTQIDEASFDTKRFKEECKDTVKIHADKVECVKEEYLPNWGKGGPNIGKNTATNYVNNSDGKCELVDWEFQWSYTGSNPGDTFYGAAGDPWETFSDFVEVDVPDNKTIWMREILEEDYIPFTYESDNTNESDKSAEFYCHNDVLNYDNYDFVKTKKNKKNYYCVGFNTKKFHRLPIAQPVCEDGKKYAKYVPDQDAGGLDTLDDMLWVGDYVAPVGEWFELPNDADTSSRNQGALILFDGTTITIDLLKADDNSWQDFAGHLEFYGAEIDGPLTQGRPGDSNYKLENSGSHPDKFISDGTQKIVFDFAVTTAHDEGSFDIKMLIEECIKELSIVQPVCKDGKKYAKYVPDEDTGGLDTVDDILWVGDYVAPIGEWFEIPNDADTSSRNEGALILFNGANVVIDLITAEDNNDRQDFAGHLEFYGAVLDGSVVEGRPGFPFYKLENGGFHTDSVNTSGPKAVVFDFAVTTQIDEASFDIKMFREPCRDIVRIHADKVECSREEFLPNWGEGAKNIKKTTASDYVANSNGECELVDWEFQWSYDGSNPGDTFYGEAGHPWNTFSNFADVSVPKNKTIWMREVLKDGYIPFTYQGDNTNQSHESAEFYCHNDVLNYDNYDFVQTKKSKKNYYCVGFNTKDPKLPIAKPVCEDGKRYAKYVPDEDTGGFDTVDDILWVGNYIAPIGDWFELPDDADTSATDEGAVILYDGTRITIDLLTANENNDQQHFAGHLEFYGAELDGSITEGRPGFPFYKLEGPNAGHPDSISADGTQSVVFDFRVTTQHDEASFDIQTHEEECDNDDSGDGGDNGGGGDDGDGGDNGGGGDDENGPVTRSSGGGGTSSKASCNTLDPDVYTTNTTGTVEFTCHGNYKTQALMFDCGDRTAKTIKAVTIDGSDRYAKFSCDYAQTGSYTPVCTAAPTFTNSFISELWETNNTCEGEVNIVNEASEVEQEEQVVTSGNGGGGSGGANNTLQDTYDNYLDLLVELDNEDISEERTQEIMDYIQGHSISDDHKMAIYQLILSIENLDEASQKLVIEGVFARLVEVQGDYPIGSPVRDLIEYLKLVLAIAYFT